MANNFTFKDASAATLTAQSYDNAGVHTPATTLVDSAGNPLVDDAAAQGPAVLVAGRYVNANIPDALDSGDAGWVAMSRHRGLITASGMSYIGLTAANPNPAGSDIIMHTGSAPAAGDFQIRDTNVHIFHVPLASYGWRRITIGAFLSTAFDQAVDFRVFANSSPATGSYWGQLLWFSIPAGFASAFMVLPAGGGVGANVGADPVSGPNVVYSVPALDGGLPSISIWFQASVAPTTGEFGLRITRTT